jgi:hypothetical protein
VIAVDQPLLQIVLGALGPLEIEGYDQPVTAANVIDYMREAWGAGERDAPDWASRHKDFIPKLAAQLLARVQGVSEPGEALALGQALMSAPDQRHLLVYLPGTPLQDQLAAREWDGALHAAAQDTLMVVDWNAGYNKTNASVAVTINYAADLSGAAGGACGPGLSQPGAGHRPAVPARDPLGAGLRGTNSALLLGLRARVRARRQ